MKIAQKCKSFLLAISVFGLITMLMVPNLVMASTTEWSARK